MKELIKIKNTSNRSISLRPLNAPLLWSCSNCRHRAHHHNLCCRQKRRNRQYVIRCLSAKCAQKQIMWLQVQWAMHIPSALASMPTFLLLHLFLILCVRYPTCWISLPLRPSRCHRCQYVHSHHSTCRCFYLNKGPHRIKAKRANNLNAIPLVDLKLTWNWFKHFFLLIFGIWMQVIMSKAGISHANYRTHQQVLLQSQCRKRSPVRRTHWNSNDFGCVQWDVSSARRYDDQKPNRQSLLGDAPVSTKIYLFVRLAIFGIWWYSWWTCPSELLSESFRFKK